MSPILNNSHSTNLLTKVSSVPPKSSASSYTTCTSYEQHLALYISPRLYSNKCNFTCTHESSASPPATTPLNCPRVVCCILLYSAAARLVICPRGNVFESTTRTTTPFPFVKENINLLFLLPSLQPPSILSLTNASSRIFSSILAEDFI